MKVKVKLLNPVGLFATLWTEAHKAPPSMGFSRQEYWSELPHSDISRDQSLRKYLRFFFFLRFLHFLEEWTWVFFNTIVFNSTYQVLILEKKSKIFT